MLDGQRMRYRRVHRGMTQADLAKAVGKDQKAISAYERGVRQPHPKTIAAIAEALRCNAEAIMVELSDS